MNMNENSIGSVTPVTNEVSASDIIMPQHGLAALGAGGVRDGQGGGRQAEHHDREEAGHELSGGRVAARRSG